MSGAMLVTTINISGSAIISGNTMFAAELGAPMTRLFFATVQAIMGFIWVEIADHPDTPDKGHPHSKTNYLQSAYVLIVAIGSLMLAWGTYGVVTAISSATGN